MARTNASATVRPDGVASTSELFSKIPDPRWRVVAEEFTTGKSTHCRIVTAWADLG